MKFLSVKSGYFLLASLFFWLLVSCRADPPLPTLMAEAEVGGLSGTTVVVPLTYTPLLIDGAEAPPVWGTISPTQIGSPEATFPFLPTDSAAVTEVVLTSSATPLLPSATPPVPLVTESSVPLTSTPLPPPTVVPPTVPPTQLPLPTNTLLPPPTVPIEPTATEVQVGLAPVFRGSVFSVQVDGNVVYGQGLQRSSWSDTGGWPMNLTLDVYRPVAPPQLRPSMLLFHGGGFRGGAAHFPNMVATANYFAARGWVVFSVNYRLEDDFGSVPLDWPEEPGKLVYPAGRDAKAAVRWVHANAAEYNVSTDHITVFGGSAGGMLALMLGASDEADFRDELDITADPTLATTNLTASAAVQTVVVFWGDGNLLNGLRFYDGRNRYDSGDSPTLFVHGTEDRTIVLARAEAAYRALMEVGVWVEFEVLEGEGHAAWEAVLDDGRALLEGVFDFVVEQQGLLVGG